MTHLEQTASPGTERGMHTPGPWHTAFEEGTKVKDAGNNTVAWLQQTHLRGKRSEQEVSANARLIAAATTMLEALQKLANEVGGLRAFESELRAELGNTNWSVLMLRLREADAAIALVEGRTPTETKGGASDE